MLIRGFCARRFYPLVSSRDAASPPPECDNGAPTQPAPAQGSRRAYGALRLKTGGRVGGSGWERELFEIIVISCFGYYELKVLSGCRKALLTQLIDLIHQSLKALIMLLIMLPREKLGMVGWWDGGMVGWWGGEVIRWWGGAHGCV